MRFQGAGILVWIGAGASLLVWIWLKAAGADDIRSKPESTGPRPSAVFTPAHASLRDALADFLDWRRPTPAQPIAFTHRAHAANRIKCTEYCHIGADKGPVARIPGVKVCMTCHAIIATDRPEIKKVAAYQERGEEIPWERVYGFNRSAHVKFNHAPHIRAGVDCAKCHGDVAQQRAAERAVKLNMGYCLDCHRQRQASTECVACHY